MARTASAPAPNNPAVTPIIAAIAPITRTPPNTEAVDDCATEVSMLYLPCRWAYRVMYSYSFASKFRLIRFACSFDLLRASFTQSSRASLARRSWNAVLFQRLVISTSSS